MNARLLIRRFFQLREEQFTHEDIVLMDTSRLQALHGSERCRDNPELLVAVWIELHLRVKDLQSLNEATIGVRRGDDGAGRRQR
jgi:hypothetical protein